MNTEKKAATIALIISSLNESLKAKNKKLCEENMHSEQKPLHGGDMYLELAFLADADLEEIARVAGI